MAYHSVAPLLCALLFLFSQGSALTEENVQMVLYTEGALRSGPNLNDIISLGSGGFGSVEMRDRRMTDGLGPNANTVGRAQVAYFKTKVDGTGNIWSMSMNLVFADSSRFSGSTLQVLGINPSNEAEWSIVGGTGKLTMARGIVTRKIVNYPGSVGEELTINAYYTPISSVGISHDPIMVSPRRLLRAI